MGAFSEKIMGSDNALDVYEDYFSLYNEGKDLQEISTYILDKYFLDSIDLVETSEYLPALLKAQWETKSLNSNLFNQLKMLVKNEAFYQLLSDFGASEQFIKKREKVLLAFMDKISVERPKAKLRRQPPKKLVTHFKNGACFSFQYLSGEFGGVVVIQDELFTTKGHFSFALTTLRQKTEPSIDDFLNSTLYRCKWYEPTQERHYQIAGIDSYSIVYSTKKERLPLFKGLETFFTYVGEITPFESGYHTSSGLNLPETDVLEQILFDTMEFAWSERKKEIHLEVYKEVFTPDTVKLKAFPSLTNKGN